MKIACLILLLIGVSYSHRLWTEHLPHEKHLYTFDNFIHEFKREYTDSEYHYRKSIFDNNMKNVHSVNSKNKSWRAGVNEFSDKTREEFEGRLGKNRPLTRSLNNYVSPNFNHKTDFLAELPDSIDWRDKGVVSKIRNQGSCGSCWAFSTIAVSEAHIAIASGKLLPLSEQQLVDCVPNPDHCGGSGGCEGSVEALGYTYLSKNGFVTKTDYPYKARDGKCVDSKFNKVANIKGYVGIEANNAQQLMDAIATKGPVSISVAASTWSSYESGIYDEDDCGYVTNHAVSVVGYGRESNGKGYWIVRNHWGEGWGERGYIRLPKEDDFKTVKCGWDLHPEDGSACKGGPSKIWVCGQCGMYSESTYPYGASLA